MLDVTVRGVIKCLLGTSNLILADLAILLEPIELILGIAPDIANGNSGILGLVLGDLDVVAAALLGELRQRYPNDLAV